MRTLLLIFLVLIQTDAYAFELDKYTSETADNFNLIFIVDYENQKLDSGVNGIAIKLPLNNDSVRITSENKNNGMFALKTMVGSESNFVTDGAPRVESNSMNLISSRYSQDEIWQYQFSAMLDKDWITDPYRALEIIFQFKRFNSKPDITIGIKGDQVVLRYPNGQKSLVEKINPGRWMNFVFYVKWSLDNSGEILVKSKLKEENLYTITKIEGSNMLDSRPRSAYLKWGLYRPECFKESNNNCSKIPALNRIIYHDDISASKLIK